MDFIPLESAGNILALCMPLSLFLSLSLRKKKTKLREYTCVISISNFRHVKDNNS